MVKLVEVCEFPPPIHDHPDIKILIAKWEAHYHRLICGEIEIEKNENGTILKKIPYYDFEFVRDLLIKVQRMMDSEAREKIMLDGMNNKEKERLEKMLEVLKNKLEE